METRRLILLSVFFFSVFMLWQNWIAYSQPEKPIAEVASSAVPAPTQALTPAPAGKVVVPDGAAAESKTTEQSETLELTTDLFKATFSGHGGDLVRLELLKHREKADKSKNLVLFDAKHHYFAQTGLIGDGLPNHRSQFRISGPATMAEGVNEVKVRLSAAGEGAVKAAKVYTFKRGSYLIDVRWEIENGGQKEITPHAYFQLQRDAEDPERSSGWASSFMGVSAFTGPAVYTEAEKYQKIDFADILGDKAKFVRKADNGWLAMVQHYFVSAWVPKAPQLRENYVRRVDGPGKNLFQAGLIVPLATVAPGGKIEHAVPLYAGPQEEAVLKQMAPGLELVVDYGWFTVLAAPLFWALQWFYKLVGNWGWAIVLLTICIKIIFYPLSAASYKSMAKMKKLMPQMTAMKERWGSDRQRLNQEMMNLYKTEKVNPLGGCLPILVQIPVFIALYRVLMGVVEMRDAPWILWITDLSSADPYYVLPIIMIASMLIQAKLNPTPPDPVQAKVMQLMPFVFGVMFLFFPAGLVLYWVVNNLLSIAQQWQITRMIEGGSKKAANDAKA